MGFVRDSKVENWLTEDGLFMLKCWSRDGLTYEDIAANVGVAPKTISCWRMQYPEIKEALETYRDVADYRVENALYKRCLGYRYKEVKTIISGETDGKGNRPVRIESVEKEIVPDVTACLAWLNNRKPTQWKRNRDNMLNPDEKKANNVTIQIIKADDAKTSIKAKRSEEEEWEAEWNAADEDDDFTEEE